MPMASWIAWLNSCTPLQAMRAPLGCGLQTRALPAASMLMALQASVGSECVTGVMTPMTPKGAYSCSDDAVLAAEGVGAQELDAGDAVGDDLELLDLVLEPADLRLFQFLAAELLGLLDADLADAGDGLAAVFEAARLELALRLGGGGDGGVDVVEDAALRGRGRCRRRGGGLAVAHLRQHLLDHAADQIIGDLHGVVSP